MLLQRIETASHLSISRLCLLGGLALMMRALTRLRSVTARRQLRWIVWGSSVGAVPFVMLYVVPFLFGRSLPYAEYTAVLLGCIPLAFASAIVRYRLMDIEVIIKKALVVAAVVLLLVAIYGGHAAARRASLLGRRSEQQQLLGAARDAGRRAGRAVAVERDSGRRSIGSTTAIATTTGAR